MLIYRTGRIATTERLPDRILRSGVLGSEKLEQQSLGRLIYIIEVESPLFLQSAVADSITKTLAEEYFNQTDGSPALYQFERAIKKVNLALADLTKTGETDWVGNLHAIIALLLDDEILVTQTGNARAYLFRKLKISHITEGLQEEHVPHPLKTFSNLVTGQLQLDDRILLSSQTLFTYIPLDRLRQIILTYPPFKAAEQIARGLRREHVKTVSAITVSATDTAIQAEEEADSVIYLDQLGKNWLKQAEKVLRPLQLGLALLWVWLKTTVWPSVHKLLIKLTQKKNSPAPIKSAKQNNNRAQVTLLIRIKEQVKTYYPTILGWLKRPLVLLIIALLLMAFIIRTLRVKSARSASPYAPGQTEQLGQAKSLVQEGITAQADLDQALARTKYHQAETILTELDDSGHRIEARALEVEVTRKLDTIDKIVRLSASAPYTKSDEFSQAVSKEASEASRYLGHNWYLKDGGILNQAAPVTLAGQTKWPTPVAGASVYNGTLYLLEPSLGIIEKLPAAGDNFGKATQYAEVVSSSSDITVDGAVWVLGAENITKIERGKLTLTINFKDTPELSNQTFSRVWTDANKIYLWNKGSDRLAVFNKTGSFDSQLALPESIGKTLALEIDASARQLYASNGQAIYKLGLP